MTIMKFLRTGIGKLVGLAVSLTLLAIVVIVIVVAIEDSMVSFGGHRKAAEKNLAHHMALHEINGKFLACESIPENEDNLQKCHVRLLDGEKNKITFTCHGFLLGAEGSCTKRDN